MKRLIVNADDFGLTDGVSAGIAEAISTGVVSSTSVMVCTPGWEERVRRWQPVLAERLGVHLQLTDGTPSLPPEQVPSLVDESGRFPRTWRSLGRLDPEEVRREWNAQLRRMLDAGERPGHIDTHHSVHLRPDVLPLFAEIAEAHNVTARSGSHAIATFLRSRGIRCADYCEMGWIGKNVTRDRLIELVSTAFTAIGGEGTVELMCHPGHVDDALRSRSHHSDGRAQELAVLCSPMVADDLRNLGITPVSPASLVDYDHEC